MKTPEELVAEQMCAVHAQMARVLDQIGESLLPGETPAEAVERLNRLSDDELAALMVKNGRMSQETALGYAVGRAMQATQLSRAERRRQAREQAKGGGYGKS